MAVTIQLPWGVTAVIDGYQWRARDLHVAKMLNALLDPDGPSGADPDPDRTAAQAAIDKLGGKIIQADDPPFEDGTVY